MKYSHSKVASAQIHGLGTVSVNIVVEADIEEGQEAQTDAKLESWIDDQFSALSQ